MHYINIVYSTRNLSFQSLDLDPSSICTALTHMFCLRSLEIRLCSFLWMSLETNLNMDEKDLVFDILKRLPAKSLVRFISVSKSWHHLISRDSCFTRQHLQTASKDSGALLFLPCSLPSKTRDVTVDYLSLTTSQHIKIKPPWKRPKATMMMPYKSDPYRDFHITCHCDGVVCVSDAHRVILWNPSIRRFKILPDTVEFSSYVESKNRYGRPNNVMTVIGFGFLDSHYHKVVRITYINDGLGVPRPEYPSMGEVYDSRTDYWTKIADEDVKRLSIMEFSNSSISIDGTLYWLGEREKTKEEEETASSEFPYYYLKITAFNLVDEKFRNIELPGEFDMEIDSGKRIAALGGSKLGLFAGDHRHRLLLTVWAMEVDELCWRKLFRINLQADPLCFVRSSEVVVMKMRYDKLVLFDPKLQDPCHFQDLGFGVKNAVDFVESLLLLDGERGEEESEGENVVELKEEDEDDDNFELGFTLFD